jgi:3-hydroxybutyryl-CoA dehydrogenase
MTARDDAAARVAAGFAQAAGRAALLIPDRPGQIVLRTLAQLANAAGDALDHQIASAEDIDAAMMLGANHPEGPLDWATRFGAGPLAAALTHIAEATGDSLYRPSSFFTEHPHG